MRKPKKSAVDFNAENLPKTRREQFVDCLKIRYTLLFYIGVLSFLFFIPLIVIMFLKDHFLISLYVQSGEAEYMKYAPYISTVFEFAEIIGLIVFAIGLSGILHIVKMLLWGEGILFWQDFREGVKQNAAKCVLFTAMIGFFRALLSFAETTGTMRIFTLIAYCLSAVILLPTFVWCILQTAFYKDGVFHTLKNSFALYLKTAPATVGLTLALLTPFTVLFINLVTVKYFVFALVVILIMPIIILAWMCYAASAFDKYFNATQYPQIVGKGLYRKK